jgi:cysteine desulfurase
VPSLKSMSTLPLYLDYNATTPVEPRVAELMMRILKSEVGNAGSTSHNYGLRAKRHVEQARQQVAHVVGARRHEVIFTSGATEANNLALLGLAAYGEQVGRRHIVSTQIEHKAVLEPLAELARRDFEVTLVPPTTGGWVEASAVADAVRDDTLLVSIMHVNNETGILQPIEEIADLLRRRALFFHVDAAQGFGKDLPPLRHQRIDLISVSGHKIFGPQGIGALITRRRNRKPPPLKPLCFGGGQEFGLRPGTLPVALIAGFGLAAELAINDIDERRRSCAAFRQELLSALRPFQPVIHGDEGRSLPHVVNLSFPGLDADLAIDALSPIMAASDGAACTSICSTPSHVLTAMGLPIENVEGGIRLSWGYMTIRPDWLQFGESLRSKLGRIKIMAPT